MSMFRDRSRPCLLRAALWALALLVLTPPVCDAEGARDFRDAQKLLRVGGVHERLATVNWLAERETPDERARAVDLLRPVIDDPAPPVRRAVANALAALDQTAGAVLIRERLRKESSWDVVPAMLLALGQLGDGPNDARRLAVYARSEDGAVRAASITALAMFGGQVARDVARAAMEETRATDAGWGVRSAAMLSLAKCGGPTDLVAVDAALERAGERPPWIARAAYAEVVTSLASDPEPALLALLEDEDARVVTTAVKGIAKRAPVSRLDALMRDPRSVVRAGVAAAIASVPVSARIGALETLATSDESREVRWTAARALFDLEHPQGDQLLLIALESEEPAVWAEAQALLRERTGASHGRNVRAWQRELSRWRSAREGESR